MKKQRLSPLDEKYLEMFPPDPNFSVEHNQRVIEESIEKNERLRRKRQRDFDAEALERNDGIARYINSLKQGKAYSVESYFGRKQLTYLRGQQIMAELKERLGK